MQEETNQGRSLSSHISQNLSQNLAYNALRPRAMHVSMLLMHSFDTRSEAHVICGGGIAGKNSLVGPTALAGTRPLLANLYVLEGLL